MSDITLSVDITKLANFERANSLTNYDKFLVAHKFSDKSKSTELNAIGTYVLNKLENQENFIPAGQWNFIKPPAMINVKKYPEEDDDVPNLKYIYDTLISKLDDLSVQLYTDDLGKKYLPSYVGMVILGNNLNSAREVQEIYGSNTFWKKIEGRFLLGAGSCNSNNMDNYGECDSGSVNVPIQSLGGSNEIALDGMPKHTHKFEECKYFGKFPRSDIGDFPVKAEFSGKVDDIYQPIYKVERESSISRKNGKRRYADQPSDVSGRFKPEAIEKTFKWRADGEIRGNPSKWKNEPHNNIPPYYVTYIWERIK